MQNEEQQGFHSDAPGVRSSQHMPSIYRQHPLPISTDCYKQPLPSKEPIMPITNLQDTCALPTRYDHTVHSATSIHPAPVMQLPNKAPPVMHLFNQVPAPGMRLSNQATAPVMQLPNQTYMYNQTSAAVRRLTKQATAPFMR